MDRPTRILVECPALIASVRLGVLEPLKALESQGKCDVRFLETMRIRRINIAWCDIFISVRGFEYVSMKVAKAAKLAGRFVIYFLDDDLLNVPSDVGSSDYFSSGENKKALLDIIGFSDVIWCVNSKIGQKYSMFGNGRWVLERVPTDFLPVRNEESNTINVLYAGSTDHTPVIHEYISPVVRRLCKEMQESVRFTFIGVDPGIDKCNNVEYIEFFENYTDYNTFLTNRCFQIGLAPVRITEFYESKYYNKFIEYSRIGAAGIYTDCMPYKQVIRNGQNGFLCENTINSWYDTLKRVICNNELRKSCVEAACKDLQQEFTYEKAGKQLLRDIPELEHFRAPVICDKNVRLTNVYTLFYINRALFLFKRHGILSIPLIFRKVVKKLIKLIFH